MVTRLLVGMFILNAVSIIAIVGLSIVLGSTQEIHRDTMLTWRAISLIGFVLTWCLMAGCASVLTLRGHSVSFWCWIWIVVAGIAVTALIMGLVGFLFP